MQDNGSNALILSQTLPAPGGSNNTDFGRKVKAPQSVEPFLRSPLCFAVLCNALQHVKGL